jgi:hypothetical protein
MPEVRWRGGKRPLTMERRSAASALARQKGVGKPIPVVEAPLPVTSPGAGGYGLWGCSVPVAVRDRLALPFALRVGDAPGVELGADPADRLMVNVGSVPAVPAEPLGVRGRRTVRCGRRGVAEDS